MNHATTRDATTIGDDRRELLRIDDRLLLECRRAGEASESAAARPSEPQTDEAIKAFLSRPTADLLSRAATQGPDHQDPMESMLVPWLMKIDWALELMLKAAARANPQGLALPRLTEVNLSGGGICFDTDRRFGENDILELRLILPPFVPIRSTAEVTRVTPVRGEGGAGAAERFTVAAHFTSIGSEDRERLIRHILRLQADRIRSRHQSAAYARSGDA
jgi:hypothetical protein